VITSVNRPLLLAGETDFYYNASGVAEEYGNDAAAHLPPFENTVKISGNDVTIHLPAVKGFTNRDKDGTMSYTMFRDEVTLHGVITATGESYDMKDIEEPGERFLYTRGTIDSNASFTVSWQDDTNGNREIISVMNTAKYHGEQEIEAGMDPTFFSKFVIYYFPESDRFQVHVQLVGDMTYARHYSDGDDVLEFEARKHTISLSSDYEWKLGDSEHATFRWYDGMT